MGLKNLEKLAEKLEELEKKGEEIIGELSKFVGTIRLEPPIEIEIVRIEWCERKTEKVWVSSIVFQKYEVLLNVPHGWITLDGLEFLLTMAKVTSEFRKLIIKVLTKKEVEMEFMIKDCELALSFFDSP